MVVGGFFLLIIICITSYHYQRDNINTAASDTSVTNLWGVWGGGSVFITMFGSNIGQLSRLSNKYIDTKIVTKFQHYWKVMICLGGNLNAQVKKRQDKLSNIERGLSVSVSEPPTLSTVFIFNL